ncbi:MAG TPA: porin [Burkholderiales bacterium]|nr:porin [Burkholderiales bacterium]
MQKKLLTLAVTGALAAPCIAMGQGSGPPQASVEVYGTINMAIGKFKYTGATNTTGAASGPADVSKWDVAQGASNYGLRGRESLGGGLTAWFQIEENAPMERSNNIAITPASRNSAVGIQGNWGNVFLGQWTTPWADLDGLWAIGTVGFWGPVTSIIGRRETTGTAPNPNCINNQSSGGFIAPGVPAAGIVCDAVESVGGVGHPFWRRPSQAVVYQSPVFSGLQFKVLYQTNESKATSNATTNADPSMVSTSLQWAGMGGRARVGAAIDRHKDFTVAGKTDTGFAIKGGYNFGVVDVGLAYENYTYKTALSDCKTKSYGIALAIPVGMGTIRGSYSKATAITGTYAGAQATAFTVGGSCGPTVTAANQADQNGAKEFNIGYEHRFSKRTNVGIGYAAVKNDPAAVLTWTGAPPTSDGASNTPFPGQDPSTYFISITHRF